MFGTEGVHPDHQPSPTDHHHLGPTDVVVSEKTKSYFWAIRFLQLLFLLRLYLMRNDHCC